MSGRLCTLLIAVAVGALVANAAAPAQVAPASEAARSDEAQQRAQEERRRSGDRRSRRVRMERVEVASPDGRIVFTLLPNAERLSFTVAQDGQSALEPSPVHMSVDGYDLGERARLRQRRDLLDRRVLSWHGAHATARNRCRGAKVALTSDLGMIPFSFEVRVFDDGVAYRHVVPGAAGAVARSGRALGLRAARGRHGLVPRPRRALRIGVRGAQRRRGARRAVGGSAAQLPAAAEAAMARSARRTWSGTAAWRSKRTAGAASSSAWATGSRSTGPSSCATAARKRSGWVVPPIRRRDDHDAVACGAARARSERPRQQRRAAEPLPARRTRRSSRRAWRRPGSSRARPSGATSTAGDAASKAWCASPSWGTAGSEVPHRGGHLAALDGRAGARDRRALARDRHPARVLEALAAAAHAGGA